MERVLWDWQTEMHEKQTPCKLESKRGEAINKAQKQQEEAMFAKIIIPKLQKEMANAAMEIEQ